MKTLFAQFFVLYETDTRNIWMLAVLKMSPLTQLHQREPLQIAIQPNNPSRL